MPEENVKKFEQKEEIKPNRMKEEKTITEMQKEIGDTEKIEEKILTPEEEREIEKRKEQLKKIPGEIKEEEIDEKKRQSAKAIVKEAVKGKRWATPDENMAANTAVENFLLKGEGLEDFLDEAKKGGSEYFFDVIVDKLSEDDNWQKLQELGEI